MIAHHWREKAVGRFHSSVDGRDNKTLLERREMTFISSFHQTMQQDTPETEQSKSSKRTYTSLSKPKTILLSKEQHKSIEENSESQKEFSQKGKKKDSAIFLPFCPPFHILLRFTPQAVPLRNENLAFQ